MTKTLIERTHEAADLCNAHSNPNEALAGTLTRLMSERDELIRRLKLAQDVVVSTKRLVEVVEGRLAAVEAKIASVQPHLEE